MSFARTRQNQPRKSPSPSPAARAREHQKANHAAAMMLDTVGMDVVVTLDDGSELVTKLLSLPWTLGHGIYVAKLENVKGGGYDCARIRPGKVLGKAGGLRLERGGA